MPELVMVVGLVVSGLSLWLMLQVGSAPAILRRVFEGPLRFAAALVRLLFGAALIGSAATVAFPGVIAAFGWLFALSAMVLVAVPLPVVESVVAWYARMTPLAMRTWLLFALGFGLFLVYASVA